MAIVMRQRTDARRSPKGRAECVWERASELFTQFSDIIKTLPTNRWFHWERNDQNQLDYMDHAELCVWSGVLVMSRQSIYWSN